MRPEDVARYLQDHPEFFEDHAEVLSEIQVPHPHGGRAIPLSERQIVSLREKTKVLEAKLRELVQYGEENDAISEKVHRISVALLAAPELRAALNAVYLNLREGFAVPHVALRLWRGGNRGDVPEFRAVSDAAREFGESLANPYCGGRAMVDTGSWFGEASAHLRSFSYLPLRDDAAFGLLALASEDPQRFYPEMGTLYLKRLADFISAALARHLK